MARGRRLPSPLGSERDTHTPGEGRCVGAVTIKVAINTLHTRFVLYLVKRCLSQPRARVGALTSKQT